MRKNPLYRQLSAETLSSRHRVHYRRRRNGFTSDHQLARMDTALQASGHPGLHVTLFDPDTVTQANIGRQLFSETELGMNKATAAVTRVNRFFGTAWMAESRRYPPAGTSKNRDDKPELANIIITCTDNVRSRLDLWRFLKKNREITINNEKTVYYWMDFGNTQTTGQVFIGTVRNKIKQPVSKEFLPVPGMNVITEEVSYSVIKEKDSGPSCSLVEALGEAGPVHQLHAGTSRLWHSLEDVQGRKNPVQRSLCQSGHP